MKRGSIACRKDPADRHEWQFALRKSVAWTEEEVKHGFQGESNAKVEAAHWLELKAKGLLEDGAEDKTLADKALQDVLPSNSKSPGNKHLLALKDMSEDEKEDTDSPDKKRRTRMAKWQRLRSSLRWARPCQRRRLLSGSPGWSSY